MSDTSENKTLRIVGISGSLRAGSHTRTIVETALRGAAEVGAQVEMLDLNSYGLAYTDVSAEPSHGVARLRADVASAQGIILGTPEYHGSFSGVLKHALDLMGFDEFEGKMIGLVSVSGGRNGGLMALNSLRMICRSLHAWVVPEQVGVPNASKMFDQSGRLLDAHVEESLKRVGREVARFSYLHSSEQAREFLRLWEKAPINPGGSV
jgi:NAD(P)H-dependent FMN reductase